MFRTSLKIFALLLGLGSLLLGTSSCNKDDDKVCCSWTYDEETYKYCEGDTYDGEKLTGDVWTAFKAYVKDYYDATCD